MEDCVSLKLPSAYDGLRIHIWNYSDIILSFQQDKAYYDKEKKEWVINIYLIPVDHHLKLRDGT